MSALRTEGIILRKYFLRETSYILVVFTREFGKIRGVLKGVRKPYPQFAANFELFTHCDLIFYKKKKKGMDLITRCDLLDFFSGARKDIERLSYAYYFVELIDTVTSDGEKSEELYEILLDGLKLLGTKASPRRVSRIFELKFLDASGFSPALDDCIVCGAQAEGDVFFSISAGGLVCGKCAGKQQGSFSVSKGTVNFMRKIRGVPLNRTQQIKVSKEVGKDTEKILRNFIGYHIGRRIRSSAFIDELEKSGVLKERPTGVEAAV